MSYYYNDYERGLREDAAEIDRSELARHAGDVDALAAVVAQKLREAFDRGFWLGQSQPRPEW